MRQYGNSSSDEARAGRLVRHVALLVDVAVLSSDIESDFGPTPTIDELRRARNLKELRQTAAAQYLWFWNISRRAGLG